MNTTTFLQALAIATAMCLSGIAKSATAPSEAARLGRDLTPMGAEQAGSADGRIPAWQGGLVEPPACFSEAKGRRYCDPFTSDAPLVTITKQNLAEYRELLTPGQIAMFDRHGDTYSIPVYRTRRTFANQDFVYHATRENATRATLGPDGDSLSGAAVGVPFPIAKTGQEVIWNHKLRFRDPSTRSWNNQFVVGADGSVERTRSQEEVLIRYGQRGMVPERLDNTLFYLLRTVDLPVRRADAGLLVRATIDQKREPQAVWRYEPKSRRWVRWPGSAYDVPFTDTDGLKTIDQLDSFYGPLNRYDWVLKGKRETLVPVNAYLLHDARNPYRLIALEGHIQQAFTRYEVRRTWVVEATLKSGASHVYGKRTFYVDEDSWQIHVVDLYDTHGRLWRLQETHTLVAYDKPYEMPVAQTIYDLRSGRYLVEGLNNEDPETRSVELDEARFTPGGALLAGR